ncbi:MAG: hypothetical protein ACYTHM_16120 [Planctomycetota bacterium]|jgi:hypothetical protein
MNRKLRILTLGLLPLAGFGLCLVLGFDLTPARAGGLCPSHAQGTYITSNAEGNTVYAWSLSEKEPTVVCYNYQTGLAVRKSLKSLSEGGAKEKGGEPGAEPVPEPPEIEITGVIWTPNPETRVAFINGRPIREGEIFVTRTGKRYKVIEIKRTKEVDYEEVKEKD